MVEKMSVNVLVLSLNVEHNFLIPIDMRVSDVISLIAQTVAEEYPGVKKRISEGNRLMSASNGKLLDPKNSLKQLGIVSGDKVILI